MNAAEAGANMSAIVRQLRQEGVDRNNPVLDVAIVNMCEAKGETPADALALIAICRLMLENYAECLPLHDEEQEETPALVSLSLAAQFLVKAELTLEAITGLSGESFTGEPITMQ